MIFSEMFGQQNIGAEVSLKSRNLRIAAISLLLILVGVSHWLVPATPQLHTLHVVLRKMFLVPVVLGAIWFEITGALMVAIFATAIYVPHIFVDWSGNFPENINQVGEVVTIWITAVLSGVLVRADKAALREVAETHEGSLMALASALDAREHETELHSLRVMAFSIRLGRQLKLSKYEIRLIRQASLLHDIGKIGTPDAILLKSGKLNEEEWRIMRQHPETGHRILSSIPFLRAAAETVYAHHERFDGTGYPRTLCGNEIPLPARVFAVVDVFDALTSDRPYHKKISCEAARQEIQKESGMHFDPQVIHAFSKIPCFEWKRINRRISENSQKLEAVLQSARVK
ncbi:MAG: HD domain-containing protein [Actinobacteria bacterium]|nr:HD domain-containing protein [Actinomycetota bacterium]